MDIVHSRHFQTLGDWGNVIVLEDGDGEAMWSRCYTRLNKLKDRRGENVGIRSATRSLTHSLALQVRMQTYSSIERKKRKYIYRKNLEVIVVMNCTAISRIHQCCALPFIAQRQRSILS
jgi:hypothetical protein